MTTSYDELPHDRTVLETPSRVLAVGAHPDDAEFGAGATLARWADGGATITMCIVTDGSKGSWDPAIPHDELIAARRAEQEDARRVIGAADVRFLDEVDGELESTSRLTDRIAMVIRETRPDVLLTHDPWQRYQLHPDHRATGWSTLDAVVRAREPRSRLDTDLPEHRPRAVLLWSADEPDHCETADAAFVSRKIEALLCHASQAETTMDDATASEDHRTAFAQRIETWMAGQGAGFGVGPAETFKRLTP